MAGMSWSGSGLLRLSQFYPDDRIQSFVLKTWELNTTISSWLLVHHFSLRMRIPRKVMRLISLHPDDENVYFFKGLDDEANIDRLGNTTVKLFANFQVYRT